MYEAIGVGLERYQQPESLESLSPWNEWASLSVACDLGSDGVSALNFAVQFPRLNLDVTHDQSHLVMGACIQAKKKWCLGLRIACNAFCKRLTWAMEREHEAPSGAG